MSERKCHKCGGKNLEARYLGMTIAEFGHACLDCFAYTAFPEDRPADPPTKTLRDEFAMAALSGLLAGQSEAGCDPYGHAIDAYQCADAMMKEREKADE